MTRIWIIRHGNTFEPSETPQRIGARTDLSLVESGRRQALELADWFAQRGIVFDRVLCSPLKRTCETAVAIATSNAIEWAEWLAEIDHGPDEGQAESAVVARIGADALTAWDRDGILPGGWIVDRPARIAAWSAFLDHATVQKDIAVVTSNGAARFALLADAGLAADAAALTNRKLRTGAFGMLATKRGGGWQIAAWDQRP